MKIKHILIFLINIFILFPTIVRSQFEFQDSDPTGMILPVIQSQVRAQYGNQFEVYFAAMDSMIGNIPLTNVQEAITDPYSTLKGTVFFWAVPNERDPENEDSVVIGIFKNGSIIWNTPPIYKGGVKQIYASRDLNKDGDVDLVLLWSPSYIYDYSTDIRIFSWNGISGRLISDYDQGTRETNLVTTGSILDIIDADGDGIYDIRAYWSDQDDIKDFFPADPISTRPWVTYCWDGTKYGIGGSGNQISGNTLLPANRLTVVTKCRVSIQNNRFKYDYMFSNDSTSQQSVQLILISGMADSSLMYAPMNWITGGSRLVLGRLFFTFEQQRKAMIMPNKSVDGFGYESGALPTIVKFYIQGERPHAYDRDENPISDETYRNDIITNSANGFTIGTSDTTQTIVPLIFLDTLTSYTIQSKTLGWIKDQTTLDKYLSYFNLAKTNWEQNNILSTRSTLQQVLKDVNIDSTNQLTSEAYALIRYNTEYLLEHLPTTPQPGCVVKLINSTGSLLTSGTLQYRDTTWKDAINNNNGTFFINTTLKKLNLRMTYEYGTLTKSNVSVGTDTIIFQTVNVQVQLKNSQGISIDTGIVQYYVGAWRNFGTTSNGITIKELLPLRYTFRLTYNSASISKAQNIDTNATVVFQTIPAKVQLQTSTGALMPAPSGDTGIVQYYSGGWKDFGITSNGEVTKELLPIRYIFRMNYNNASIQKAQSIDSNSIVVFQTVNSSVELRNSQNTLLDTGIVQYYAGSWKDFGTTLNGIVRKELLPARYNFRMTYNSASKTKVQNLDSNAVVVFQTAKISVQLRNSQDALIDTGIVQYYSGGWKDFGVTENGITNKELLPVRYTFRMTYGNANNQKAQNTDSNAVVTFQTVNAIVQLQNSQGSLIDTGTVQYYSGGWKNFGKTSNGLASKELLANNYNFRMTYNSINNTKAQNLDSSRIVNFSTALCTVRVTNASGQLLDNAIITYYASRWKSFGTTVNGAVSNELLPSNITFRVQYGNTRQQKAQDINVNPIVEFSLP